MQTARGIGFSGAVGRVATHGTCAFALVASLTGSAEAQRASGIQLTPDSARYLINKDVGAARWAITYNLADKTITGNILDVDAGTVQFVWCQLTSVTQATNPADADYTFDCSLAAPCAAAPCSNTAWTPIGTPAMLKGSFLLPPETATTFAGNVQPIFDSSCAIPTCHVPGGTGPINLSSGASYAQIFKIPATEDPAKFYVTPFDADGSYLYNKIEGTVVPRMPLNMTPLPLEMEEMIEDWILEGAANN